MFLRRLNPREAIDVQMGARFFCNSPQYMEETFGRAPTEEDGRRFVTDVPAGCASEDVFVFAAFEKSSLLGMMQIQRHFVRRDLASIGLLLVDPAMRRRHIGCRMLAQLSRQARNWPEVARFCVTVLEINTAGLAFWRHAGFVPVARGVVEPPYRSRVTIMERLIRQRRTCLPAPRQAQVAQAAGDNWLSARLHKH